MKNLLILACLVFFGQARAQGYKKIIIPVGASVQIDDGTTVTPAKNVPCEGYFPRPTNDSICLLIAECGTPQTSFTIADNYGPGYWLTANPHCYDSIVSPWDGKVYRFITLVNCWDSATQAPIEPQYLGQIIRYMQKNYKIFKRRVYMTGFSQGGANTVQMASMQDSTAAMIQGYVAQSAANFWQIGGHLTTFIYNNTTHTFQFARGSMGNFPATKDLFTKYGNGMWWQHGNTDNVFNITNATSYRDSMWSYFAPHSNFNLTTGAWGHGNWNFIWDPVKPPDPASSPYTVLQWLLQFPRSPATKTALVVKLITQKLYKQ